MLLYRVILDRLIVLDEIEFDLDMFEHVKSLFELGIENELFTEEQACALQEYIWDIEDF